MYVIKMLHKILKPKCLSAIAAIQQPQLCVNIWANIYRKYSMICYQVSDILLPTHVVPEHYKIRLLPFIIPDNYTIKGHVEIKVRVNENANNITLHASEMEIHMDKTRICTRNKRDLILADQTYDHEREFFVIHLDEEVKKDEVYLVILDFTAHLNNKLHGFYRSDYVNDNGEKV